MSNDRNLSLGEAVRRFLASLPPEEAKSSQQEINRFVRWFGVDSPLTLLSAPEVAGYADRLSVSDSDYSRKLEQVKVFLVYARKQGWLQANMAAHLKPKKGKPRPHGVMRQGVSEAVSLTREKYDELKAELEKLKTRRDEVIGDIRRAAADKDFRENAPLEAAREQHGQIMGRIRELEETLKSAVIFGEKPRVQLPRVNVGDRVVLEDVATGEEMRYMIVSPREANPTQGKISNLSPVGKAVMGREQGQTVAVTTPAGKFTCRIKKVER